MRKNQRKLTARQVVEIVKRYKEGETGPVLASEYGVGRQQIYNIISGRSWEIVTGITEPVRHHRRATACRICGDTHYAKNYCRRHYNTVYRPRTKQNPNCRICGERSYSIGLCRKHHDQWRALLRAHKKHDLFTRINWGEEYVTLSERNQQIVERWLQLLAQGQTLWAQRAWGASASDDPELYLDAVVTHNPNREQIEKMKISLRRRGRRIGQKIIDQARRTALTIENDVRWALANAYRF